MYERQYSTVDIKRGNNIVLTVPITKESKRTFKLMETDCITLKFVLAEDIAFEIGDYIEDEIFGTFYITEKQVATKSAGAYSYDLRFDADYMRWKNYLFLLVAKYLSDDGKYPLNSKYRKECEWVLTAPLSEHVAVLKDNLDIIGFTGYTFNLEGCTDKDLVECITYSGTDIISALNTLANAYECEWWVKGKVVYFGKCESGEPVSFSMGTTVEKMTANRNASSYANRLYVFGSTQNIPDTYRKDLVFNVTSTATQDGKTLFIDSTRKVRPSMLKDPGKVSIENVFGTHGSTLTRTSDVAVRAKARIEGDTFTVSQYGNYDFGGSFGANMVPNRYSYGIEVHPSVNLYKGASLVENYTLPTFTVYKSPSQGFYDIDIPFKENIYLEAGSYHLVLYLEIQFLDDPFDQEGNPAEPYAVSVDTDNLTLESNRLPVPCSLVYGSTTYNILFNPFAQEAGGEYYLYFAFSSSVPTGFTTGSRYTLLLSDGTSNGLLVEEVPSSFYSSAYDDPSSLYSIAERRLLLPREAQMITVNGEQRSYNGKGYVEKGSGEIVEMAVKMENIYPRCILRITSLNENTGNYVVQKADGSESRYNFTKYSFETKRLTSDGTVVDFPFKSTYISEGKTLQIKFLTKDEEEAFLGHSVSTGATYMLSGMTFGVNFSNGTYTIVWNEDYGATLPNNIIRPNLNDPFILLGWNVKMMEALGLIATGENELLRAGYDYLDAIEEDQYTCDCDMMSDHIYQNGLYDAGQRVTVTYGSTVKSTRIIGYEYELARPYNTPRYTVGETEAYSRTKELQKKLNATEQVTHTSGNIVTAEGDSSSSSSDTPSTSGTTDYTALTNKPKINGVELAGDLAGSSFGLLTQSEADGRYALTTALSDYLLASTAQSTYAQKSEIPNWFLPQGDGSLKLNPVYSGLWAEGFVSALGTSSASGGGSGTDLSSVWTSLTTNTDDYKNRKIHAGHLDLSAYYTQAQVNNLLSGKQATLVSGTNIKTINGVSILGSGNITIETGSGGITTESDPVFTASPAHGITSQDITNWNNKLSVAPVTSVNNQTGAVTITASSIGAASASSLNNYLPLSGGSLSSDLEVNASESIGGLTVHYDGSSTVYGAGQIYDADNDTTYLFPGSDGTLALRSDIPSLSGYATQSWVQQQGYLTSHQSLADYVTLGTTQTISGTKTFTAPYTYIQNLLPSAGLTYSLGSYANHWNHVFTKEVVYSSDWYIGRGSGDGSDDFNIYRSNLGKTLSFNDTTGAATFLAGVNAPSLSLTGALSASSGTITNNLSVGSITIDGITINKANGLLHIAGGVYADGAVSALGKSDSTVIAGILSRLDTIEENLGI